MKKIDSENEEYNVETVNKSSAVKPEKSDDTADNEPVTEVDENRTVDSKKRRELILILILAIVLALMFTVFNIKSARDSAQSAKSSTTITTTAKTTTEPTTAKSKTYSILGTWKKDDTYMKLNKDESFIYSEGTGKERVIYKGSYSVSYGNTAVNDANMTINEFSNIFHIEKSDLVEGNVCFIQLKPMQMSYGGSAYADYDQESSDENTEIFSNVGVLSQDNNVTKFTYYDNIIGDLFEFSLEK